MNKQLQRLLTLLSGQVFWLMGTNCAQAQPIEIDRTTETVLQGSCVASCEIEGGLQQGRNLFHSFSRFDVGQGATVQFINPGVANIFSRVTGSTRSEILGTLGVSGGRANLFFINPNGIFFGPDSSLNVTGSFLATTANTIQFQDQGFLNASASQIPLLSIDPSALLLSQNAQPVEVSSVKPVGLDPSNIDAFGLKVPDGESLILLGGDVVVNGGLNAFSGYIELGGLSEQGLVQLDTSGENFRLQFPGNTERSDISINGSIVNVSAANGGDIILNARNINISESELRSGIARDSGSMTSRSGDIILDADKIVEIADSSEIFNTVRNGGKGRSGNIYISSDELIVNGKSRLESSVGTSSIGNAGNIALDIFSNISLDDESFIINNIDGTAQGSGGDINITTRDLDLNNFSSISAASFGPGKVGNVLINATGHVSLDSDSRIGSTVVGDFIRESGKVEITARELSLKDGSQVATFPVGEGPALGGGNISVIVSDIIDISGSSSMTGNASGLFTFAGAGTSGSAGNIVANADTFYLRDGGAVSAQTFGLGPGGEIRIDTRIFEAISGGQVRTTASDAGKAGNIAINATERITIAGRELGFDARLETLRNDLIEFEGRDENFVNREIQVLKDIGPDSGFFANTALDSTGDAGSISVNSQNVSIQDDARIEVSNRGNGLGGNIDLRSSNLTLNNGAISATTASSQGGDIQFTISDLLLLRNGSKISTSTNSNSQGGNIKIDAGLIFAFPSENSDITADSQFGPGGQITITTQGIFGLAVRDQGSPLTSDITATSLNDPQLNGQVTINTPETDPSEGVFELPTIVPQTPQIAQSCRPGQALGGGSLVNLGRGGLPSTPRDVLTGQAVWEDLRSPVQPTASRQDQAPAPPVAAIVEAQGWQKGPDGRVTLVPPADASSPQLPTPAC